MSTSREYYLARAAECRAEAETALLLNVKERCFRSEAAWLQMAARAETTEIHREHNEARKAALLKITDPSS